MRDDVPPKRSDPLYPYFPPRPWESEWHDTGTPDVLAEVHLYDGSFCNRECSFCCVGGSPRGWYEEFGDKALQLAAGMVHPEGRIKFYGGEPSLHAENVIQAARFLRGEGFRGTFVLFTNGIRAAEVIRILEAVPEMEVSLNYSILHGRGAPPLPERSLEILLEFPEPRIFSGHAELEDTGVAPKAPGEETQAPGFEEGCPHCYPVVRSDGIFHGCPFAVEMLRPHFDLGRAGDDPALLARRFRQHVEWQRRCVEPEAARRGITPCQVCQRHLDELPVPDYERDGSDED